MGVEHYAHSLRVELAARDLAVRYGADVERAALAGLLHDYARDLPEEQLKEMAIANNLISHPVDFLLPVLLHAPVGAYLVSRDLGILDQEILDAIARHTIGNPTMSVMEKVIFLADMIEPGRSFPGADDLRRTAEQDLDKAMLAAFDSALSYVISRGSLIHPVTVEARNNLLQQIGGR
ncbi:hypothetical protein SY88_09875 [Clostridiales bacterium PH28_bin88]|nr:hypothetical protein SY88_09875 [Clostridiales bacterium PH28_bin88]